VRHAAKTHAASVCAWCGKQVASSLVAGRLGRQRQAAPGKRVASRLVACK
jgi:hypothetical protein